MQSIYKVFRRRAEYSAASELSMPPATSTLPTKDWRKSLGSKISLPLALLIVFTVVGAAALGAAYYLSQAASEVLLTVNQARANTRQLYNSTDGYGRPTGSPVAGVWSRTGAPPGWAAVGDAIVHGAGAAVAVESRVATFSVSVDRVWPAICWQVLPSLDSGWKEISYAGSPVALPMTFSEALRACGWFSPGRLTLLSTG